MKHFFSTALIVLCALSFVGCKENKNNPNLPTGTKWEQAVKEHPFLANFPKYDYDYQETYQTLMGVEMYQVTDWKSEEKKFVDYKSKLEKAGFTIDKQLSETSIFYTKQASSTETLEAYINYLPQMININLSLKPENW